jgi:hypothetical protein
VSKKIKKPQRASEKSIEVLARKKKDCDILQTSSEIVSGRMTNITFQHHVEELCVVYFFSNSG